MKILYFINGIYLGGKERRLLELMKELKLQKKLDFELVVMNCEINYQEIFDLKIKIHYLLRKTKKDLSIFSKFYSICVKLKPDIVHCWDSMTAIYCIPACKLLKIKLVNGMIVDSPLKTNIFNKNWLRAKLTFPFSDIIISNSNSGLKAYNSPPGKSFVIKNGFNFNRNKKLLEKGLLKEQLKIETDYIVGMVATFSEFKDYKTYYKASEIILRKRKDVTFLAIGNKTDSTASKQLVDKEYHNHFRFLGKQSNIESYINLMDVCILATFTEGISNSILEYMALGKAVVATDGGGTKEIVVNNDTGFLVKHSDALEMATKIELLINNEKLRLTMGENGQRKIKKDFSIDQMVNNYISYYNNLKQGL